MTETKVNVYLIQANYENLGPLSEYKKENSFVEATKMLGRNVRVD